MQQQTHLDLDFTAPAGASGDETFSATLIATLQDNAPAHTSAQALAAIQNAAIRIRIARQMDGWKTKNTFLLQQNQSFGATQVHFSCRRLQFNFCKALILKSTKYDMRISWLTVSSYELPERHSYVSGLEVDDKISRPTVAAGK